MLFPHIVYKYNISIIIIICVLLQINAPFNPVTVIGVFKYSTAARSSSRMQQMDEKACGCFFLPYLPVSWCHSCHIMYKYTCKPPEVSQKVSAYGTCGNWLWHSDPCVFSLLQEHWRLVALIPFISLPSVLFQALLALESPTPSSEREAQERLTTPWSTSRQATEPEKVGRRWGGGEGDEAGLAPFTTTQNTTVLTRCPTAAGGAGLHSAPPTPP